MKKLGLIGGTGPESTLIYYKEINRLVHEAVPGAYPEIVMESINLYKATGFIQNEEYNKLIEYFSECITHLVSAGAEIIALTAGTMHIIFNELKKLCPVPLISIPETVAMVAKERGYRNIGLLGTIFTMEKDYLKKPFWDKKITIVVPKEEERRLVHTRIFNELEMGIVKESTQQELIAIMNRMKNENHIEAIILGCTELPLALTQKNCPVDCLDIMKLHIAKLVKLMIE